MSTVDIDKLIEIANSISSPWGEGATYDSVFSGKSPKLDIAREIGISHLDDDDWKVFVEDLANLLATQRTTLKAELLAKMPTSGITVHTENGTFEDLVSRRDVIKRIEEL